jgi:hypothetical protein
VNTLDNLRAKLESRREEFRKNPDAGFTLMDIMVVISILGVLIAVSVAMFGSLKDKAAQVEGNLKSELRPTPAPAPDPVAVTPPPDLTMLWISLGVAGGLVVLAVLVTILVMVIRHSRHGALQLRQQLAAKAEDRRKALEIWNKSVGLHKELSAKVLEIEMDWDMLFSYPALVDASVPQTRDFHRALRTLDSVSAEPPADLNLAMAITELPYPKLVAEAEESWLAAWSFAKRTGTKLLPKEERKKIDQILQLLKLARDSGGSENERSVAYGRAAKLIGELRFISIPQRALATIDTEAQLMLEAVTNIVAPVKAEKDAPTQATPEKVFAL